MRTTAHAMGELPTGQWLTRQRERLAQTIGQVATAVKRHSSTIRAIERNNRVIPPGWSQGLRKLGIQLPTPTWSSSSALYFGHALQRDLNTCVGMRDSRYWLSKQLCVPEELVVTILRGNHLVPQDWLLKLAELGANVPAVVQLALREPITRLAQESTSPENKTQTEDELQAEPRRPPSISLQWSCDEGLQFHLATPLLEQVATVVKEMLLLYGNGLLKSSQHAAAQRTAEPSRG